MEKHFLIRLFRFYTNFEEIKLVILVIEIHVTCILQNVNLSNWRVETNSRQRSVVYVCSFVLVIDDMYFNLDVE